MTWRGGVAFFQGQFTAAMDDACTIRTNAQGRGNYSKVTKTYDAVPSVVYSGACLFRPAGASDIEFGERQQSVVDYVLLLPHGTTGLEVDQQVTVDSLGTTSPLLVGQVLTVTAIEAADSFNARVVLGCQLNRGGGS